MSENEAKNDDQYFVLSDKTREFLRVWETLTPKQQREGRKLMLKMLNAEQESDPWKPDNEGC
jgi:hypothetical protein